MAITITHTPQLLSAISDKIIVTATSTNVLLDGFKYFVEVYVANADPENVGVFTYPFYISPNPAGALVFDIAPLASKFVRTRETNYGASIHAFSDDTNIHVFDSNIEVSLSIIEAWIVSGTLTVNVASEVSMPGVIGVINAKNQIENGYELSSVTVFGMNNNQSRFLSDRKKDTYKFTLEPLINADPNAIIIPVRESDYGVITTIDGAGAAQPYHGNLVVSIMPSSGAAVAETFSGTDAGHTQHAAVYPANLNGSAMALTIKPQDYPNWKYLKVQAQGAISAPYYLVNIDHYGIHQECKHDNVRIAWVGSRGGWEYFNFNKKNEESVQVERKRYEKVVGTYDAAIFGFLPTDAGLKELKPVVQRFITVNSDWIQEGEFEYLKGLIVSDAVHMVLDSGTHIPMLVEQNDYTAARERNGKMKNLTLKLRYANDLNV